MVGVSDALHVVVLTGRDDLVSILPPHILVVRQRP
jgi:hypothetical protein